VISRYLTPILIPFLLLPQASTMAQRANPVVLQPCIQQLKAKRTSIKTAYVNQTYQQGAKTYYLVTLFPSRPDLDVLDAVLSSNSFGCQVLAQYPSGMPIPVTTAVPLSVARGLTLNILKSDISKLGGLQKYQASLNIVVQDTGRLYLGANDVWALDQVGIHIPPGTKIISPSPR